ncbi:MAG TPA: hypothetical protein PLE18_13275 [Candidatus Sumerlaeota bacterium]|nr:hypothetical protein [Candidatus Sumerlaeota bacterium]
MNEWSGAVNDREFLSIVHRHFEEYLGDVLPYVDICKVAGIEAATKIAAQMDVSADAFAEKVLQEFLSEFGDKYKTLPIASRVDEWVKSNYEFWRHDAPIGDLFPASLLKEYPELQDWRLPLDQNLAMADQRTQDFLRESDYIYLGKYIHGDDSQRRLREFIRDEYIDKGTAIGRNPDAIAEFKRQFKEYADYEDWKVRRIIDTSVNQTRNFAHIRSLQQVGAEIMEIAGPNDNLTCSYCANMLGRKFRVGAMAAAVDRVVSTNPESLPVVKPFLSSQLNDPRELKAWSDENLESRFGLTATPPYHPHCRHRVIISEISAAAIDELSGQAEATEKMNERRIPGVIPPEKDGLETDAAKGFKNLSGLLEGGNPKAIKDEVRTRKDIISKDFADMVRVRFEKDRAFSKKWNHHMPPRMVDRIRGAKGLSEILEIIDGDISFSVTSKPAEFLLDMIEGAGGHHRRTNKRIINGMLEKLTTANGLPIPKGAEALKKYEDMGELFKKRVSELKKSLDPIGVFHPSILQNVAQKLDGEKSVFEIGLKNLAVNEFGRTYPGLARRILIEIAPQSLDDSTFFAKVVAHELIHHGERSHEFSLRPFSHWIMETDNRNKKIYWRDYAREKQYRSYQERMTTTAELPYLLMEMGKFKKDRPLWKKYNYNDDDIMKDTEGWNFLWGMVRGFYADIYK